MRIFTTGFACLRAGLCAAFLLTGAAAWAQNAPTWTLAKRTTSGGIDPTRDGASNDKIQVDASGNIYVTGGFHGVVDLGGSIFSSLSDYDSFLAKYSPTGSLLWAKHLNGANYETMEPALALDATGNVYLTGSFYGSISLGGTILTDPAYMPGGYQLNGYVAKFDPQGTLQWAQRLGGASSATTGSGGGSAVAIDATGQVLVAAWFSGTVTLGSATLTSTLYTDPSSGSYPSQDILLAKLDPQGTVVWARHDGGTGDEYPSSLAVDAANNIYLGGDFDGSAAFGSITLTNTTDHSTGVVVKYDAAGTAQWASPMPAAVTALGENVVKELSADPSGNVSLVGYIIERPAGGGDPTFRTYVARYLTAGTLAWSHLSSSNPENYLIGIVTDAAGNSYLTQTFMGSITLAGVTLTAPTPLAVNLCLMSLTPQGTLRWSRQNDSGEMGGSGIALDQSGQLYVSGAAIGAASLGNIQLPANSANYEPFFARLSSVTTATRPGQTLPALALCPNPTQATATVRLPAQLGAGRVVVRDLTGRLVQQVSFAAAATQAPLTLTGVAPGLYTVQVQTAAGFSPLARLVVQ